MKNVKQNMERKGDLMDITFETKGNFDNLNSWLNKVGSNQQSSKILNEIGKAGVTALSNETPVNTGETASSWSYKVEMGSKESEVSWYNTAHPGISMNLAIALHTGYVTGTGGYVPARPYITSSMTPIYSEASQRLMEAITNG